MSTEGEDSLAFSFASAIKMATLGQTISQWGKASSFWNFSLIPAAFTDTRHDTDILHEERSKFSEFGHPNDGTPCTSRAITFPAADLESNLVSCFQSPVPAFWGLELDEEVLPWPVAGGVRRASLLDLHCTKRLEGGKHVTVLQADAPTTTKEELVQKVVSDGVGVKELTPEPCDGVLQPVHWILYSIATNHVLGTGGNAGVVGPMLHDSSAEPVGDATRAGLRRAGQIGGCT